MKDDPTPQATDVSGQVTVWTLNERQEAAVQVSTIAAIITLKPGGPTRLLFTGGGTLDICGGAEYWRAKIRLTELEAMQHAERYTPDHAQHRIALASARGQSSHSLVRSLWPNRRCVSLTG